MDENENEDKFEFDESLIDEVSNSEEFSGEDVSREEVVDAIGAIDALAEVAIEKLGGEQADINADELLEKVQELVDDGASDEDSDDEGFDEDEEEFDEEEEELPEEIENSMIRVMVSEDDTIKVEKTPDEIYDATIDDIPATVFDTGDIPEVDVEDEGETDEDGVLVIGNSRSRKFRKGFVKVTSCKNNKAWSAAYKKVKKMIGSAKLTAYHWAIVSSLAKAYDKAEKARKQKLQSCLLKLIKNNKDYTAKFGKLLKSDVEEPISDQGQTEKDVQPEETVQNNPGVNEEKDIVKEKSPEEVDSEHKEVDPPAPWDKNDEVVVPKENIINLEVPVKGITQKLILRKVASSKKRNASTYKVLNASKIASFVASGKIVKMGDVACAFKKTPEGTFACFARFEKADGKTKYVPVIKNGRMVITKGKESPAFAIASSFEKRRKMADRPLASARKPLQGRRPISNSRMADRPLARRTVSDRRVTPLMQARKERLERSLRRERLTSSRLERPVERRSRFEEPLYSERRRPLSVRRPVVSRRRPLMNSDRWEGISERRPTSDNEYFWSPTVRFRRGLRAPELTPEEEAAQFDYTRSEPWSDEQWDDYSDHAYTRMMDGSDVKLPDALAGREEEIRKTVENLILDRMKDYAKTWKEDGKWHREPKQSFRNVDRDLPMAVDYVMGMINDFSDKQLNNPVEFDKALKAAVFEWYNDTYRSFPDFFVQKNPAPAKVASAAEEEVDEDEEVIESKKKPSEKDEEAIESKKTSKKDEDECVGSECDSKKEKKEESKEEIESRVRKMYEAEERKRLFQSSQDAIAEDKAVIKESVTRNSTALDKLYSSMF